MKDKQLFPFTKPHTYITNSHGMSWRADISSMQIYDATRCAGGKNRISAILPSSLLGPGG